jgi:hypothetical protein
MPIASACAADLAHWYDVVNALIFEERQADLPEVLRAARLSRGSLGRINRRQKQGHHYSGKSHDHQQLDERDSPANVASHRSISEKSAKK